MGQQLISMGSFFAEELPASLENSKELSLFLIVDTIAENWWSDAGKQREQSLGQVRTK